MIKLKIIGIVDSELKIISNDNPRSESDPRSPTAIIKINHDFKNALIGLEKGMKILLFTWLHKANRNICECHPQGNISKPRRGVFATRSPGRPNPIGFHEVIIEEIDGLSLKVNHLEAIDGTPVVDIKKK